MEFFYTALCHRPINNTTITLIPKVDNALFAKDFTPIACFPVIYKLISKILTSRLQQVITEVVSCSQTRFIPGRQIVDNILLATELIRGYNRSHITTRMSLLSVRQNQTLKTRDRTLKRLASVDGR